jgi:hypothetical protein
MGVWGVSEVLPTAQIRWGAPDLHRLTLFGQQQQPPDRLSPVAVWRSSSSSTPLQLLCQPCRSLRYRYHLVFIRQTLIVEAGCPTRKPLQLWCVPDFSLVKLFNSASERAGKGTPCKAEKRMQRVYMGKLDHYEQTVGLPTCARALAAGAIAAE